MNTHAQIRLAVGFGFAVAIGLVVGFGGTNVRAQPGDVDWDGVVLSTHHVSGTVHYLEGRGGNIGLSIGDDGVVMIDDQFGPLADRIREAINGISNGNIRFLINTHVHGDHTGGNENFAAMGVPIVAQDRVRDRLAAGQPAGALPVLTFSDDITINLNGDPAHVIPMPPGHTDGDSIIHFVESDVIHTGDMFRTVAFPVIDRNNGGTLAGTIEALGLLAGMAGPNTKILPGHGVVAGRADVIEFRDMVITVADRVEELVKQGRSYAEVVAANPTREYQDKWGDPERFLTAVFAELGGAE
ncbi:MAG: MBL fold metallo-hydrolase [Acidobacteria bacterium]|nr:MBL fold metallo-hydrolase [Acidobacteriota bacterium]